MSAILLIVCAGAAIGIAMAAKRNHSGAEASNASVGGGCNCQNASAPPTVQNLNSFTVPDGGEGKISSEDHLVTKEDPTRAPINNLGITSWGAKRSNDGIDGHLSVTGFSYNCPSESSYCNPSKQEWTPEEGGGKIGEGNRVGLGNVPAIDEPWVMNARWPRPYPDPGTRVIITAKKTGRSIVAVAGYEWGPSESTGHVAGAQKEVLANLGIVHGDEVSFGFAQDQKLKPGTVYASNCGSSCNTSANYGSSACSTRIINIARKEVGQTATNDCNKYDGGCNAWCSSFVSWVYKQAGYMKTIQPYTVDLKKDTAELEVVNVNGNANNIKPGDIFWVEADSDSGYHVGIVESIGSDGIHTIEGNVGREGNVDRVAKRIKKVNEIVTVARPKVCK